MQVGKTRAIGVDGEHRATVVSRAAPRRGPIQGVPRYNQPGLRVGSVHPTSKVIQVGKTRAIGVDGEHRASARISAQSCSPIQGIAR
jgi:hypothetical protein